MSYAFVQRTHLSDTSPSDLVVSPETMFPMLFGSLFFTLTPEGIDMCGAFARSRHQSGKFAYSLTLALDLSTFDCLSALNLGLLPRRHDKKYDPTLPKVSINDACSEVSASPGEFDDYKVFNGIYIPGISDSELRNYEVENLLIERLLVFSGESGYVYSEKEWNNIEPRHSLSLMYVGSEVERILNDFILYAPKLLGEKRPYFDDTRRVLGKIIKV